MQGTNICSSEGAARLDGSHERAHAQRLQRRRPGPDRPAPEPGGGAVRPGRGAAVGHDAAGPHHRRAPHAAGLLPLQPRPHLPGDAGPEHDGRADRRAHHRRAPQAGRRPGVRGRRGRDRGADGLGPGDRQRPPVRADRARERDAAAAPARLVRDPGARARARGAPARARRPGGAAHPRGRPRGRAQGLQGHRVRARRGARQAPEALARGHAGHGHARPASRTWTRSPAASSPAT